MKYRWGVFAAVSAMSAAVITGAACTGGGGGSSQPAFGETECAECILSECDAEIDACSAIADCADALQCALDCPEDENGLDFDCVQNDCEPLVTTSAGGGAFSDVGECYVAESSASGTCESQCAPPTE